MSNIQLIADLVARDKSFSKTLAKAGGQVDKTQGKFSKFGKTAAGALAGIGVTAFAASSGKAYAAAEAQQVKLEGAYKRFPKIADVGIESLRAMNAELQTKTKFDNDDLAAMQAKLAMFDLTGSKIQELTPIVADYAQVSGKDLETAAVDVGKALLGNTRALKTLGIDYDLTGDKATDLANIQDLLRQKVAGAAEEYGGTTAGQLDILANQYGELKETIGEGLAPALTQLVQIVTPLAKSFSDLPGPVKTTAVAVTGAALAVGYLSPALSGAKSALSGMSGMFSKTAAGATNVGAATGKASSAMSNLGTAAAVGASVTAVVQALNVALESSDSQWARVGENVLNAISPVNALEDAWRQLDLAMNPVSSGTTGGIDDPEVLRGIDTALGKLIASGNIDEVRARWVGLTKDMTALQVEQLIADLPGLGAELRKAGISIDDLTTSINAIPSQKDVTIALRDTQLQAKVSAAQAKVDSLRQKRPTDIAAIDKATREVVRAQARLDSFRQRKQPDVRVNTDPAKNAISTIESWLNSIPDEEVMVYIKKAGAQLGAGATVAKGMRSSEGVWATVGERGPELMYVPEGASVLTHSQSLAHFGKGKKPKPKPPKPHKPGKKPPKKKPPKGQAPATDTTALDNALSELDQLRQAAESAKHAMAERLRGFGSVVGMNPNDHAAALEDVKSADNAVRDARANVALARSMRDRRDAINSLREAERQQREAQQKAKDTEITPANVVKRMRDKLGKISRFRDVVRALAGMGLRRNALQDIIGEGPEVGLAIGEALLKGGIGDVNAIQDALDWNAMDIGALSSSLDFDSQIAAAQGAVNALPRTSAPVNVTLMMDSEKVGQVTLAKQQRKNRRQGRRGLGL